MRHRWRTLVCIAGLLLAASTARADKWLPFRAQRFVSPQKRHYLDAKPAGRRGLSFELGRADKPVAKGELPYQPWQAAVLDQEPAAVLFEKHGNLGHGNTLALLDATGKLRWHLKLADLFDAETIGGFVRTVSSIRWNRGFWVDEKRGVVAVVSVQRHVREVDLKTGKVVRADQLAKKQLLEYLEEAAVSSPGALDVLAGLEPPVATIVYLMTHADAATATREAAAGLLRRRPPDEVLQAVVKEMRDADAEVGGLLLRAAIATGADDLVTRLRDHETALIAVLDRQTGPVDWLAGYFRQRPTSEAVRPLLKVLTKNRRDPRRRRAIIAALKPCTGLDFGDDVDAWLRGVPDR